MKSILFYTANGVGLGHLQRAFLIAEKIKSKNTKIILVTPANSPQMFGKFFHHLVKLTSLSDRLLKMPGKTKEARLSNDQKFFQTLKKFRPDLIIADFYLSSPFTWSSFKYALDKIPTKSVFVWRIGDKEKFNKDLNIENNKLDYFQKIILPHSQEEISALLSKEVFKKIKDDKRFIISGPVFRKMDREKLSFCRRKYSISPKDFLILVTLGAGGKLKGGQCESVDEVINAFFDIRSSLIKFIPNLKTIIIPGPYSQKKGQKFEKYLPELIKISNLVISTAGYNTCNEIIQAKIPSVLAPLMRGDKEQFSRADYLEEKGIAKVCKNISPENLLDSIFYCRDNLKRMKDNFKKFSDWKQGNDKAAQEILSLLRNN
jgi:predicted glycosyltransferase